MIIRSLIISYLILLIIQITLSDVLVYNYSNENPLENIDDEESDIDPSVPSKGILGYITTTNPLHACGKIDSPPDIPTFNYQWIALIPRTRTGPITCNFAVKVKNAYNANFSAVIIYNDEDTLFPMQPDEEKDVGIPSILITHSSGLLFEKSYLYNSAFVNGTPMYHIKIVSDESKLSIYLISFIIILGFAFICLLGFMLIKFYLQRRRTRHHRLPRSALKQLRIKKFVKTDPWEVCAICLDDYEEGAKIRILPCEHAYHMKCIDPWLLNNRRQCPVCKRYVFPNDNNSDDDDGIHNNNTNNNNRQQVRITTTEQTPLINSNVNDNDSEDDISRTRQASGNGVHIVSFPPCELSDDEKDLSLSSGPATTAELVFERSSSLNPRRYGSINNPSITSHHGNFLVGSLDGINDNTNVSRHSMIENISDVETTDGHDERIHSITYVAKENPAYINDEQSTDTNQTNL